MYIKIHAHPKARKEEVKPISGTLIEIWVREPAERNLANKRIVDIIRERYPNKSVKIISGYHTPHKIVSIDE